MNPTEFSSFPSKNSGPTPNEQLFIWLKLFLARNPFYIVSAGMLLYGIYRLSIDPKVFVTEIAQLFFNFGSLQVYEVLLVGTAVVLARRKIWYDSMLLVWLENLFLF